MNSKNINSLLQEAAKELDSISDSALLDAELLLAHCLKKDRSFLYAWPEKTVSENQLNCFKKLIKKRATDYPVAYLLGKQEFWSLELIVNPDVLIPRPETELLVETALDKIKDISNPKILDLGTGSGAIALAIASERKDAIITATDTSKKALEVAKQNAVNLKLEKQIKFTESDWFSNLIAEKHDVIVSNPPYIAENDPHLYQSIRFEPQTALISKTDGLSDIKIIINNAKNHLKENAWLILEHGYDQAEQTKGILKKLGYISIQNLKDYQKNPRVTLGKLV